MSSKKFAVFDIDGTLIRWQLYHAIVDKLAKLGKIDDGEFASARAARMVWKNRASDQSFDKYQLTIIDLFDDAIKKIKYSDFIDAVNIVFDEYKDQVYTYTRDLIKQLQSDDYTLFAISASQVEIVEILARYYGFDDWAGSQYEIIDGKFTGRKDVLSGVNKPRILDKLVTKHNASYDGSIAVGDSDSDVPMLEKVTRPIAFNPNKKLFQTAKANNWQIVVERKNTIYQLEPTDQHEYYLKD